MPRRRDPNFITGHLCRFCGELVLWCSAESA
jgi:argininosuccinate lyase